jgi:hypothetical protein
MFRSERPAVCALKLQPLFAQRLKFEGLRRHASGFGPARAAPLIFGNCVTRRRLQIVQHARIVVVRYVGATLLCRRASVAGAAFVTASSAVTSATTATSATATLPGSRNSGDRQRAQSYSCNQAKRIHRDSTFLRVGLAKDTTKRISISNNPEDE